MTHALKRILLILAGCVCIVLGIVGLLLPIMPGWVFFLLAVACFVQGSDRIRKRFESHKGFRFLAKKRRPADDNHEIHQERRE